MRVWVMLGLLSGCHCTDPSPGVGKAEPSASLTSPRLAASVDVSRWLGLTRMTGDHAPVQKVAVNGEGCVKDRPCPFAPASLPPCPSSLAPLDVSELRERFDALSNTKEPLFVKGTLTAMLRTTAMACSPKDSCCNHSCGWMGLLGEADPHTVVITSISASESAQANPTHFVGCAGDDSGVCCPLPREIPVIARGWPFRLRLSPPDNLALADVKLCSMSTSSAEVAGPDGCEFDGLRYRDGATLDPPGLCVSCECSRGTWQRRARPECLRLGSEPLSAAQRLELRKHVAATDARGHLGPYVLSDDGLGEPTLGRLKKALVLAGATELTISVLPKGTSTLPATCHPEPTPGVEVHFPF